MCELLVGLPDVNVLAIEDRPGGPLGVHVENPNGAFALYEGLGYRVVQMYGTFQKPV